jgi:FtsP/CotA-like multicopper oxidase with cupredoxin domain
MIGLFACTPRVSTTASELAPFATPPEAADLEPDPRVLRLRLVAEEPSEGRYTYNGTSPGPTIRAAAGDMIIVELENRLSFETTIHWHGVGVPYPMDGVPWRQAPVMPGETFTYAFAPSVPGTFWYHPHLDTEGQVEGGLYGALIVEDPAEPRADEVLLIVDAADEGGTSAGHGHGRIATAWKVNGVVMPEIRLRGGTAVRARVINASNAAYLELAHPGLVQIGSDQGLLPAAAAPERVLLVPGDRADLEWRIGEIGFDLLAHPYSLNGGRAHGDPAAIARVEVDEPAPLPSGHPWPFPGGSVSRDPNRTDIVYAFAGSDRTGRWLINGESFPNVTVETVRLGDEVIVEARNLSATEHPFHIHGLRFEVIARNGVAPVMRTIEDTVNVAIRERVRIRLVADNPGDWMTHCHILPHAEEGMMTVLRVE